MNYEAEAEELVEQADNPEASVEEVAADLEMFHDEYSLPESDAIYQARNKHELYPPNPTPGLDELSEHGDDTFIDLVDPVEVTGVDSDPHDALQQAFYIGNKTGETRVSVFNGTDVPTVEEGDILTIDDAITDEYQGRYSLRLADPSTIHFESDDIEVEVESDFGEQTVEGAIVRLPKSKAGLIERCPVEGCSRVLSNGHCSEHGDVDGEYDVRIKAKIDIDGDKHTAYLDAELVEEHFGIDLEQAKEMRRETMQDGIVVDSVANQLLGQFVRLSGTTANGDMFFVNEMEFLDEVTADQTNEALADVRGMLPADA